MENSVDMIQSLLGNSQSLILAATVAAGLLAGRFIRFFIKIALYFAAFLLLFILGMEYVGLINVTFNPEAFTNLQIMLQTKFAHIGVSEHMFFWVPFAYSMRKTKLSPMP